ncbi:N-6 DNA methylase [Pseudomonas sp. NPDC078700]|uniref:N-6 DNA methylase n=1 Tax=Pseudomonas sp. NPDC078700 TaxID=3364424 RepID=UPI0037CB757D
MTDLTISQNHDQGNVRLAIPDDKILDFIDGKTLRADKPEEHVRQNIAKRLVNSMGYPKGRLKVEFGIKSGSSKPRLDIAVFDDGVAHIQENVYGIIECKKETTSPSDKKEGVEQLKSYMSVCPNAKWGLWTNGKHREVWLRTEKNGRVEFVEDTDMPLASGKKAGLSRQKLEKALGDVLLYAFKACHNHIHVTDGFQKEKSFFELLKIIFCKIEDEKGVKALQFYVDAAELNDPDGQIACKKRILDIFARVKVKFPTIFPVSEGIDLKPTSLVRVVSELHSYSLLKTNIDIKGKAYEEIVGSNLKGDRGQFFTPRNFMEMTVHMVNPRMISEGVWERVLDPSCGTGGFVVSALLHAIKAIDTLHFESTGLSKDEWDQDHWNAYRDGIKEIAERCFFGFDIAPELAKAAKMNMVMNNDGSGNMLSENSLLPPHQWSIDFREALAKSLNLGRRHEESDIKADDLSSWKDLAKFDVIVTNPPFGSKIPVMDQSILGQYDLARIWDKPSTKGGKWTITDRLQKSVPPEQLFIERCIQFLRPGGRMGIVLPDSILGSPGLGYIRQWIRQETTVYASVDLHQDAFQPHTGVQTSILIVQKKTDAEKLQALQDGIVSQKTFMAIADKVGHDKRGNTIFKRDDHGNDILVNVEEVVKDEDGGTRVEARMERVIDDQAPLIALAFDKWKEKEGLSW